MDAGAWTQAAALVGAVGTALVLVPRGRVALVAGLGVLAAIAGVVLVSRTHPHPTSPDQAPPPGGDGGADPGRAVAVDGPSGPPPTGGAGRPGRVLGMALGAALGFGLFYVFVDAGTGGSPAATLWVIAGARASSLVLLSTIAVVGGRSALRWPGRRIGPVALVGIGDTAANLLFALASTTGNLAVVGVLGSLYPVATVVLARWLLGERLSRGQNAGVALALTGVGLLAAA